MTLTQDELSLLAVVLNEWLERHARHTQKWNAIENLADRVVHNQEPEQDEEAA